MKNKLSITILILSLILSLLVLPACNDSQTTTETASITKTANSARVDLYNFENWQPDFSCIKISKNFGVIRRNKDKTYTKSGNYSCRVVPIGGHIAAGDPPYFWLPTKSPVFNFDYQDFTYVDYVSCWVYSDNDEEQYVIMGLVDDYVAFEKTNNLTGKHFVLAPKSWTQLILPIDFNFMSATVDDETISSSNYSFNADSMTKIEGIYFSFLHNVEAEEEFAPVYYFDDVTLVYKDTPNTATPLDLYDENSQTKTLIDFESIWQNEVIRLNVINFITTPLCRVVDDKNMLVKATSGRRMFELTFNLFKYSEQDEYKGYKPSLQYWNSLIIPEYMVREFYKTYVYDATLDNPYKIPRSEWDKWYMTFDVYNASQVEYNFGVRFYSQGFTNALICTTSNSRPNTWNTVKFSLAEIANLVEERITNSGEIRILWQAAPYVGESGNEQDLVSENFTNMKFYFDTFKLQKFDNV